MDCLAARSVKEVGGTEESPGAIVKFEFALRFSALILAMVPVAYQDTRSATCSRYSSNECQAAGLEKI